jgi:hypothetical protein
MSLSLNTRARALSHEARVHAWSTAANPAEPDFRNSLDVRFFEKVFVVRVP